MISPIPLGFPFTTQALSVTAIQQQPQLVSRRPSIPSHIADEILSYLILATVHSELKLLSAKLLTLHSTLKTHAEAIATQLIIDQVFDQISILCQPELELFYAQQRQSLMTKAILETRDELVLDVVSDATQKYIKKIILELMLEDAIRGKMIRKFVDQVRSVGQKRRRRSDMARKSANRKLELMKTFSGAGAGLGLFSDTLLTKGDIGGLFGAGKTFKQSLDRVLGASESDLQIMFRRVDLNVIQPLYAWKCIVACLNGSEPCLGGGRSSFMAKWLRTKFLDLTKTAPEPIGPAIQTWARRGDVLVQSLDLTQCPPSRDLNYLLNFQSRCSGLSAAVFLCAEFTRSPTYWDAESERLMSLLTEFPRGAKVPLLLIYWENDYMSENSFRELVRANSRFEQLLRFLRTPCQAPRELNLSQLMRQGPISTMDLMIIPYFVSGVQRSLVAEKALSEFAEKLKWLSRHQPPPPVLGHNFSYGIYYIVLGLQVKDF